jgi:hypothetical protein
VRARDRSDLEMKWSSTSIRRKYIWLRSVLKWKESLPRMFRLSTLPKISSSQPQPLLIASLVVLIKNCHEHSWLPFLTRNQQAVRKFPNFCIHFLKL